MISAEVNADGKYAEACGLVQWDYGQALRISGYIQEAEGNIEVHFANGKEKALIVMADVRDDETIEAKIPDELLKTGRDLKAYVYFATSKSGKTVRIINMPVKRRPKPDDYSDTEEASLLRSLQEELKKKADNMKEEEGYLQLLSGGTPIGDRIRLPAGGGSGGREIELKNDGASIKWRYTDSNEWKELIKVSELRGKDGITPEFEIREGHLFAIYNE